MGKSKRHVKPIRRTKLSAYERLQWCKRQWVDDPTIPIQGPHGMIRLMKANFGVAASYQVLQKLHEGVLKENAERYRIEAERAEIERKAPKEPFNAPLTFEQVKELSAPEIPSSCEESADSPPPPKPEPKPQPKPEPRAPRKSDNVELKMVKGRRRGKRPDFQQRQVFALQQLRLRPHMPLQGPDGLNELIRARFGVGMSYHPLRDLKLQVQAELQTPDTLKSIMSAMPEIKDEKTSDGESAIRTAAELIKDSIPNLKEFVLTVDEDGKTRVSYKQHIIKSGELVIGE